MLYSTHAKGRGVFVCVCVCVFYEICSIGSIVMDFRTLGLIYAVALLRRRLYLTKIYVFFIFTVSTAHQDGDFI